MTAYGMAEGVRHELDCSLHAGIVYQFQLHRLFIVPRIGTILR